jgi:LmbE family N-acetylglucosaminyl deacetylase
MSKPERQGGLRILVVAPHPDDESIGCGGTIRLHFERGDRLAVVFLTSGELGLKHLPREEAWRVREREAARASKILGIQALTFLHRPDWYLNECVEETGTALAPILERQCPEMIYLPHPGESHPDHKACLPVVLAGLARASIPAPRLLTYEVWTPMPQYDHGEDITPVLGYKVRAIRAHRSQVSQLSYDRGVRGLNQYRGAMAWGCPYAEVFQHVYLDFPADGDAAADSCEERKR